MKFLHLSTVAALALMATPAFAQYLAQPDQVPSRYIPSVNAPVGSPQPAMTEYSATPVQQYGSPAPTTTTTQSYAPDHNTTTPQYPTSSTVYVPPVPGYTPPAGTMTYSGQGIATQPAPAPAAMPVPPSYPAYAPAGSSAVSQPVPVPTPVQPGTPTYSAPMGADSNQPQPSGDFVSGGVGSSDQEYIRSIEKNYNLKVLYAGVGGEFLAIVNAKITDKSGNVLYQSATDGPVLLAKLKPGTYTLESELNGKTHTNKVTTGHGLKSITVRF